MPKLIITIEEKLVDVPGHPEAKLCGLETSSNIEIDESEIGQPSILFAMAPIFLHALSEAQKQHIGRPLYEGPGRMEDSQEKALEKIRDSKFPVELDA